MSPANNPAFNWIGKTFKAVKKRLVEEVKLWRLRNGKMSREELLREIEPPEREEFLAGIPNVTAREEFRQLFGRSDQLKLMSDLPSFLKLSAEMGAAAHDIAIKYGEDGLGTQTYDSVKYLGGVDLNYYRPSGARIFNGFFNPFQVFSFFAENHWACKAAIEIIVTEVAQDGYRLDSTSGKPVRKGRHDQVETELNMLGIAQFRLDLLRNLLAYGNALVLPHHNRLMNLTRLEILIMDRAYPCLDKISERIVGWDYWTGYVAEHYTLDQLYHLKFASLKQPDIGVPPLGCLAMDIESDIAASSLNSNVMHTAGMIGTLIVMNDPNPTVGKNTEAFGRRLQREIQATWSGVQGANSIMVTNYVQDVHKLTEIGQFDASFLKMRDVVAKSICTVLRVPPEKISISRSSGLQYQAALVEEQINAGFDKAVAAYMDYVDGVTNKILSDAGIKDLKIVANGRYGALTLNGARAGKTASDTWGLFTVNKTLERFYGDEPLPAWDPRGYEICDNSKARDQNMLPFRYAPRNEKEAAQQRAASEAASQTPAPADTSKIDEDDDGAASALVPAR